MSKESIIFSTQKNRFLKINASHTKHKPQILEKVKICKIAIYLIVAPDQSMDAKALEQM